MTTPDSNARPIPQGRRVTLAYRMEFAAWRAVVGVLSLFPLNVSRAIGEFIGRLGYFPLRIRRRLVEHQLAAALPELPDAERRRIAKASYANLGRIAVEAALLSTMPRDELVALFHPPVGWEHVERALRNGRGFFLVSGHLGNWELGFPYFASRGLPVSPVGRNMANPLFTSFLVENRSKLGLQMLGEREMVAQVPRRLDAGHAIAMLADQGAKSISSIFVNFFGRPARTPKGPAVMALRLDAACVFTAMVREPDGKFRVYVEPVNVESTGDRDRDVEKVVTEYTALLEKYVRKYPEQYLWQHRRWRRRPDGTFEDV